MSSQASHNQKQKRVGVENLKVKHEAGEVLTTSSSLFSECTLVPNRRLETACTRNYMLQYFVSAAIKPQSNPNNLRKSLEQSVSCFYKQTFYIAVQFQLWRGGRERGGGEQRSHVSVSIRLRFIPPASTYPKFGFGPSLGDT